MRGHTVGTVKLGLKGGNTDRGRESKREREERGREQEGERERLLVYTPVSFPSKI